MATESQWTVEEFSVLLASSEIDAETLFSSSLPSRSPGAIGVVRQGVLLLDEGKDTRGILSQRMLDFLSLRPRLLK